MRRRSKYRATLSEEHRIIRLSSEFLMAKQKINTNSMIKANSSGYMDNQHHCIIFKKGKKKKEFKKTERKTIKLKERKQQKQKSNKIKAI